MASRSTAEGGGVPTATAPRAARRARASLRRSVRSSGAPAAASQARRAASRSPPYKARSPSSSRSSPISIRSSTRSARPRAAERDPSAVVERDEEAHVVSFRAGFTLESRALGLGLVELGRADQQLDA